MLFRSQCRSQRERERAREIEGEREKEGERDVCSLSTFVGADGRLHCCCRCSMLRTSLSL